MDNIDLNCHGSADARKYPHVVDVPECMLAFAGGPPMEDDVDVNIWRYHYYGERSRVANL